ncbi:hypothetical protein MM221_17035 [Salipaludibacillus sp. LMS25]|jgi:hypothetical protein|uniref:hypothetical protein n=1 Tax=Salipaludibacillus sp. LMS25 TaxID=2924031 RepID=UPI0020D0BE93|nr:hypothetical protein [Salipaludibacillus sp. LMS25]UTR14250.1 hypothetical protein MM221_17035 [Salipaludibacillus sp. LMS25]
MNIFQRSEKQRFRKNVTSDIEQIKKSISLYEKDATSSGFTSKQSFESGLVSFKQKEYAVLSQNEREKSALFEEREILEKGKVAIENRSKREVVFNYPNNPEIKYIDHKTVESFQELKKISEGNFPSIEMVKKGFETINQVREK